MKIAITNIVKNEFGSKGIEELSIYELINVRGGNTEDKSSSKEKDVYDTRDT